MKTLLKTEKLGKIYGTNVVLHDIDVEINQGEIIGLIGENGAGKSTLMKIIAGVEKSSMGRMTLRGETYSASTILEANRNGIGMVFQEQSLVSNLSVSQNIFLGREKKFRKYGIVNWGKMNVVAKEALENAGVSNVEPNKKVETLPFALREMVEIAKVLNIVDENSKRGSIILLDEATTVLSEEEIQILFGQMRRMAKLGNAVVFISHRLDEIMEICDKIYVFKDGGQTAVIKKEDANLDLLYSKMVGDNNSSEYYVTSRQTVAEEEILLSVKDVSRFGEFNNVSFDVKKGEVLSICGVEGSGKESLCSVLCGDLGHTSGTIDVSGKKVNLSSPYAALKKGILVVPKDRRDEGIVGLLSIKENIVISSLDRLSVGGIYISVKKCNQISENWINKLKIKCTGIEERINKLSGGNAQKVVFARAIESEVPIVILNHPTRGVDVGAKVEIYSLIRDITEKGCAVIVLGDTLDESIGLASRIIVMKDGLVTGGFDCQADKKPTQIDVIKMMM